MFKRREVRKTSLQGNRGRFLYRGEEKRVLIISNDKDNSDSDFPTVASLPRTTCGGRIPQDVPIIHPGCVISKKGEGGCNEKGIFDCFFILRIHKKKGAITALQNHFIGQHPIGILNSEIMHNLNEELRYSISDQTSRNADAFATMRPTSHVSKYIRGMLFEIADSTSTWHVALVLSNTELARLRNSHVMVIVHLDRLPEGSLYPDGRQVVSVGEKGAEGKYVLLERTVRTIDLTAEQIRPLRTRTNKPLFLNTDDLEKVTKTVLLFLDIE